MVTAPPGVRVNAPKVHHGGKLKLVPGMKNALSYRRRSFSGSMSDSYDVCSDVVTEYQYVGRLYSNIGELKSEKCYKKQFLSDEIEYVDQLREVVQIMKSMSAKHSFETLAFAGHVDNIYSYHVRQFLPDLETCRDEDVVHLFFKHRMLFYWYDDFFRVEPFLKYLNRSEQILDFIFVDNKCLLTSRMEDYGNFLDLISTKQEDKRTFMAAKKMIVKILERGHRNNVKDSLVAELVTTEMRHLHRLKQNKTDFETQVFSKTDRYNSLRPKLVGKLDEMIHSHSRFLVDLKRCLFDFDILDVLHCFLKHSQLFKLFVEDRKVKDPEVRERCVSDFPLIGKTNDITVQRLFHYTQLLDKMENLHRDDKTACQKLNEVQRMLKKVQTDANNCMAITAIRDCNIDVESLGIFWKRGTLKVSSNCAAMNLNKVECEVYLFDKAVVFCQQSKTDKSQYVYVHHVLTRSLKMERPSSSELKLSHRKYDGRMDVYRLHCDESSSWHADFNNALRHSD